MRPELELIEKIELYLNGEMSAADKAIFQKQIANDPLLHEQVRLQEDVMNGIERNMLRQKIMKAGRSFRFKQNFTRWGLGGLAGSVVLISLFLLIKTLATSHAPYEKGLPEFNEAGEKIWASADSNIKAQTFLINAAKDTVIETKGGIVMAIPANGFIDENGNVITGKVDIAIKEALDPATMMDAGLSTRSGGNLLESGGMFFIDARKDGKIVKINPANGIYTEIPANEIKPGMQLFSGKRMPDGTIDWIAPKPLEQDLVTVGIKTLNFYPPDYLDSLAHWNYDIQNKEFTDSLYYSFASLFSQTSKVDSTAKITSITESAIGLDTINNKLLPQDGKTLFMTKCASCHHVFKDGTGPKLGEVLYNDYYKGDIKKITKWINNVNKMVNTEPHYVELKTIFGSVMTQFDNIPEEDVASIFNYINDTYQGGNYISDFSKICGINPAKIKAIWNEQFQNTFIATREFEERLKWIHYKGDPAILDLYLDNLDKPLYYIDSIAALRTKWGVESNMFSIFAARRDGKVKTGSAQLQLLKKYYENKAEFLQKLLLKHKMSFGRNRLKWILMRQIKEMNIK